MALMTVHIPYNLRRDEVHIEAQDVIGGHREPQTLEEQLIDAAAVESWMDEDEVVTRILKSAVLIREIHPAVKLVDALEQAMIWERG